MQCIDPRIADLAQQGQVRIGVFRSFQYARDPVTGEPAGLAVEIARALAARLQLGNVLTNELPSPAQVIACVKAGTCDLGFMNIDLLRMSQVDFTPPFVRSEFTYLVPVASNLGSAAEVDAAGIRIAAVRGHASTTALLEILKCAHPMQVDSYEQALDLLQTGKADAFASIRQILIRSVAQWPSSRVLKDAYARSFASIAVELGNRGRLACISEAMDNLKNSGLLQRLIDNLNLHGVELVTRTGDLV